MIDKKDLKNIDNFAIWKIESGILLKKYEMHIVKGKMMHKPVKVVGSFVGSGLLMLDQLKLCNMGAQWLSG